jgi:hypothetical protein
MEKCIWEMEKNGKSLTFKNLLTDWQTDRLIDRRTD